MDKVKLGRAIGYGARHAARAAMQAMDAATAPDPSPATPTSTPRTTAPTSSTASQPPPRTANPAQAVNSKPAADRIAQAQRTVQATTEHARAAGRHAKVVGRSVWSPLARFSSVLWLQVTGSIYGLISLTLGQAVWVHRNAIHLGPSARPAQQLYLLIAALMLFAYFCLSAFIRAARR